MPDSPPTGLSLYDYSATITCASCARGDHDCRDLMWFEFGGERHMGCCQCEPCGEEFNRRYWAAAGVGA